MASVREPGRLEFVQSLDVPEFAISGIAHIEKLPSGWLRALLYETRTVMEPDGPRIEHHVICAVRGPADLVPKIIRQLAEAFDNIGAVMDGLN